MYDGYLDTDGCRKYNIFSHTTNKKLTRDLITLASSVGHILKYRENKNNTRYFGDNKEDKERFVSYELKIADDKYAKYNDYYVVPVKEVKEVKSTTNVMYNFTVDTPEHLFELPNGIITHQCCRLRLDLTELQKRNGGLFGSGDSTGSIGVVTINLPRLAYKSKGDKAKFFKLLDEVLVVAKDSLEIKRDWLQKHVIDTRLIPAFNTYVGTMRNHFSTIGVVGMNEMCENFFGKGNDILSDEGREFALEVGAHIREKLLEFQQETGNLYNFEATPAESTCYRLALKDKKEYPDIITRGTAESPYYTNSCHIPVSKVEGIKQVFDHQEDLQIMFTGGTVIHIFCNGAISGETAKSIIHTVCSNYKTPYVSISPLNRYCREHGYIADAVDKCPVCNEPLQMYQRITGYLRCVDNYNDGKRAEFNERSQLELEG
ncbi:MAG: hypothetical protein IJZ47_07945 [Oscillospiraceae bacterium]|nr:hypothetical protein [Oscillospiraceae bacterium]